MGTELITVEEMAARLKVPLSWVYQRTRSRGRDRLPHIKLGKYIRFEEEAVRRWLETQQIAYGNSGRESLQ